MNSIESEDNVNETLNESIVHEIIMRPYNHLIQTEGKNIRSKFIEAINQWFQISDQKLKIICEITEMLHNASLLIDDIEDNSKIRRGLPTAHQVYGIPQTLNAGNYAIFYALEMIGDKLCEFSPEKDGSIYAKASKIYCEQLLELHRGQGLDIYWRDSSVCPTEEEYIEMISKKTGGLFGLSFKLMQLFSNEKSSDNFVNIENLIRKISIYFQIRDDYSNLKSLNYHKKKGFAEDLTEGKFSFPIIHAINSFPDDQRLIKILRKRPEDEETKKFAIELIEKSGSFIYTVNRIKQLNEEILSDVQNLGSNQIFIQIMAYLKVPED